MSVFKRNIFAIVCMIAAVWVQAAPLKIGWAMESIDPGRPSVMPGFGSFRYSYGCEDPIYATALVIENGEDAVIFVSMDIISSKEMLPAVVAAAEKFAPELPANKFLINATHTHSSLNIYYDMAGVPEEFGLMDKSEIKEFIAYKVVKAAKAAWKNRKAGKIAWGYGLGVTAFNRRMVYFDDLSKRPKGKYGSSIPHAGHAVIHGVTNDEKFSGYENGADNYIQFLYTFDMQGKLTGAIINTAATSQFASGPQRRYTSDFWHDVRVKIRSKYPDCYILAQCAAAGDLMPYGGHFLSAEMRRLRMKYGEKFLKDYGKTLDWKGITEPYRKFLVYRKAMRMDTAERIFNVFEDTLKWAKKEQTSDAVVCNKIVKLDLTPMPIPPARVAKARRDLEYWTKNKTKPDGTLEERAEFHFRRNKTLRAAAGFIARDAKYKKGGKYNTEIRLIRIGDVAFASNEFELFMDYMHRIQSRSPFIQTFVVELAGHLGEDQIGGYLPTERAVENRGYSATVNQCPVSPEGGQELVEATVKGLKELYK